MITKETPEQIRVISEKVEQLHQSSNKMIEVMERQIDAIVHSNTQQIEELANLHATLTVRYTENEQEFIQELSTIITASDEKKGIKLLALKEIFPDFKGEIEYWQTLLQDNVTKLQRKHHQIMELLDFAMSSNAKMLETLYAKGSEKSTHYSAKGSRSTIMPGIAINQKA